MGIAKGNKIKVLSGSISDCTLTLPKEQFLAITLSLHGNKTKKKKILSDLWETVNNEKSAIALPKKGTVKQKDTESDSARGVDSGQDSQEAPIGEEG